MASTLAGHRVDRTVAVPVKPGGFMDSQSGIQRRNPRIFCRLVGSGDVHAPVFVLVHPTSNFHHHYLAEPLAARGGTAMLVNTRYIGNDSMLVMERAIQDLGAAIDALRDEGYSNVVLVGNSGGGSLAAFYVEQARAVTIADTPDGRPFELAQSDVPRVDRLALVCPHPGRAEQLLVKIDPSVPSEATPWDTIPGLDMFDPRNGPPYGEEWLAHYREAQAARLARIEDWVLGRIAELDRTRSPAAADEAFVIQRTQADPRLLDLAIDPNDRKRGTLQGDAREANYAANGLARFCTLRSFLSQWSARFSRANGPRCLARARMPVLVVNHTADQTTFPSQIDAWMAAAGGGGVRYDLAGAPHYADDRPHLVDALSDRLFAWATDPGALEARAPEAGAVAA
ncbi:MAG: alpha/beta hydrolase [Burkholderiales bacterium]